MEDQDVRKLARERLKLAAEQESQKFEETYLWLEQAMSIAFFQEVDPESIMLITHNLMRFSLQNHFAGINLKKAAIVLCLDSPDADIRILEEYAHYGITSYRTYISTMPLPDVQEKLRIAIMYFSQPSEDSAHYTMDVKEDLLKQVKLLKSEITERDLENLIKKMSQRFLVSMPQEWLAKAIEMYVRAQVEDSCQYTVFYDENAIDNKKYEHASMNIILAWADISKSTFLYRVARTVYRHGLVMKGVNATFVDPYSQNNTLIMVLRLHGRNGEDAREVADIPEFLRELTSIKYFHGFDTIDRKLVTAGVISGTMGNLLRTMGDFIHQHLVHMDSNLYSIEHIEEDLCRYPELIASFCHLFHYKFNPEMIDIERFKNLYNELVTSISKIDTGQEENDLRCKTVLKQMLNLINYALKTNFYRNNETTISFRLNPSYLDHLPFDRTIKFPELPYGIFFIRGLDCFGFQIRFKDLARGGLRTVFPEPTERIIFERNNIFSECYNLAYTQQKKNKDIPEGGAKATLFLNPYKRLDSELEIIKRELELSNISKNEIDSQLTKIYQDLKMECLFQAQRAFVEGLLVLCNCEPDGKLRARHIVDYWKKPEYLYLGPDENMYPEMITWIDTYSQRYNYKPGASFISSSLETGFNHKYYGVTSWGVTVCMEEVLKFVGIDPKKDVFTIKMTGGPDGDVAGNEMVNLHRFYSNTAKLLAVSDKSGIIFDPKGLDLSYMVKLFHEEKPVKYYPPDKLSEDGYLIDKSVKRNPTPLVQQTACFRKRNGKVVEDWLSGSELNYILQHAVHGVKADVFIPAGGRPRTLKESNLREFLDDKGTPTSKVIIEGANLYLTQQARHALERLGVLIVKDSSANKGGVICSSFEVLCVLALGSKNFVQNKNQLIIEVLERIRQCCSNEVKLLLSTHKNNGEFLTDISELISKRINHHKYEILDYLEDIQLSTDPNDPLIRCYLRYCLPTLRTKFLKNLMQEIPDNHKKAIIAAYIAAYTVYHRGLEWTPSIVEILPMILSSLEDE